MDNSGNVPPAGEVRVTVQLMPDRGISDPRDFAKAEYLRAGSVFVSEADVDAPLAGTGTRHAYTMDVMSYPPGPGDNHHLVRYWFERSPFFSDRMLVITANPADVHATEVALLMKSLAFQAPAVSAQTSITRAEVTGKYTTNGMYRRIDRVEAKLVKWKDYENGVGTFRSYTNDPDQLVWVVLVSGDIDPPMFGPAGRPSQPVSLPYVINILDAASGTHLGLSTGPDKRPAWFDQLNDLAP
jgi:hypothetical protein